MVTIRPKGALYVVYNAIKYLFLPGLLACLQLLLNWFVF